ncbi:MAG: CRISPR system precrRNA processing endoribonuclease RAMP protein Cas6 [Candidatus Methanosuratincola sp.]
MSANNPPIPQSSNPPIPQSSNPPTPALLSLVLILRPLEVPSGRAEFPTWWGRASQAALLDLVRRHAPALAEALHNGSSLRPYTASNLMGHFHPEHGAPRLDQHYWLRWTGLTAEISVLLRAYAETARGTILELDHLPFQVEDVFIGGDHPWAGSASYNDLAGHFLPGAEIPRRVTLLLASPVVFKSDGLTQPLPSPSLIFHSLLEKWNAFAPVALMPELRRYVEECLVISRFHLESRSVPIKEGGLRIGAVGKISFTTTNFDRFWMGQIHALARFALFAGVGAGTAFGLGQTRSLSAWDEA